MQPLPPTSQKPRREWLRSLVLFGSVCVICLGLAEVTLRVTLPPPGFINYDQAHMAGLVAPDPVRGYQYASNFRAESVTPDYGRYVVVTNELGLRDDPIDLTDTSTRLVLAVGDSYTAGQGVNSESTWPQQLEGMLNMQPGGSDVRVINAGVSGYSIRQIRQTAEELVGTLKPKLLIAGVYGAAFGRIDNPFTPFHGAVVQQNSVATLVPTEGGFLSTTSPYFNPIAKTIDLWLLDHSYFGSYLSRTAYQLLRASDPPQPKSRDEIAGRLAGLEEEISKLQAIASSAGIPFVVLLINRQEPTGDFELDATFTNEVIVEYCREHGIPVVDPLPELRRRAEGKPIFRLQADTHWTPLGHTVAAELTAHRLAELSLFSH